MLAKFGMFSLTYGIVGSVLARVALLFTGAGVQASIFISGLIFFYFFCRKFSVQFIDPNASN